jgi:hypothetical protein
MYACTLWQWYIKITITILDIPCPVFYLKHDVSETGFCLSLQVGPTEQVPPEDGDRIQSPKCRVLNKSQGDG